LGALIVFGLWALYRVVATQLEFARRQSNFVAAVSHELKTPLTAIRMHGEMLQEGLVESPEKAQEYYKTITGQAERLSRLIGNVLWLSKIEKSTPVEPTVGNLAETIESAVTAIRPHVEKSGFELQLMLPGQMPRALFDADSVEQILFKLVDNAVKYGSGAEDKRLTISAEVTEQHVSICIRDRGPGIPESERQKIFEAFYRLEDELTRKNTGTGLGLALVSDLAARMNAKVRAQNAQPGLAVVVEFQRAR
jgi:signal transduction histidine kinase